METLFTSLQPAIEAVFDIAANVIEFITSNPILLIYLAFSIVGAGFWAVRAGKKAVS